MTWHDFEILFAMAVLMYCLSVMLVLSLEAAWFAFTKLIDSWMNR